MSSHARIVSTPCILCPPLAAHTPSRSLTLLACCASIGQDPAAGWRIPNCGTCTPQPFEEGNAAVHNTCVHTFKGPRQGRPHIAACVQHKLDCQMWRLALRGHSPGRHRSLLSVGQRQCSGI